ncbi:MAG: hypothetical protein KKC73_02640 [Proteobacteria bacterium]|nr:hypothetical protein [Pseudomonadota bacterium]
MNHPKANRFQDFFEESKYTLLKNYLYNYRLRKMAVEKSLQHENIKLILQMGSGISSVMTRTDSIVYSDLSFTALRLLKHNCIFVADIFYVWYLNRKSYNYLLSDKKMKK